MKLIVRVFGGNNVWLGIFSGFQLVVEVQLKIGSFYNFPRAYRELKGLNCYKKVIRAR